jgi:hypothetical protein
MEPPKKKRDSPQRLKDTGKKKIHRRRGDREKNVCAAKPRWFTSPPPLLL